MSHILAYIIIGRYGRREGRGGGEKEVLEHYCICHLQKSGSLLIIIIINKLANQSLILRSPIVDFQQSIPSSFIITKEAQLTALIYQSDELLHSCPLWLYDCKENLLKLALPHF